MCYWWTQRASARWWAWSGEAGSSFAAQALVAAGERDAGRVRSAALARLAAEADLRPQYCEVVDAETLRPVALVTPGRTVLAVAGHLGTTRLIDNADLG